MEVAEKRYIDQIDITPEQAEQAGAVQIARVYRNATVSDCIIRDCKDDCKYDCSLTDRSCDFNCGLDE